MRIIIDLQGAQAQNCSRGIGRYSLSLALAIARNRGNHEVILALNGLFPDSIEHVRALFQEVLPQENIRVWYAPDSLNYSVSTNSWRRQAAELTREAFLAHLNPSVLLVTSLFEGLIDDAVTSVGGFVKAIPTAVILYDLIPFINPSPYLDNPIVSNWYDEKIGYLRYANQLLAISESSRQEGIRYLGFPEENITNISTAADPQFGVRDISEDEQAALYERYGLKRPYVMYTGGIDHRKNIEGLIRAYAGLPNPIRQLHQLAVVCSVQPHDRIRLETLAIEHGLSKHELILTGYVPEDDLIKLYNLCKAFVFPSWHEGFGLPVLEAMCCGRAVIVANTSSLPEVIGYEEAMFDPFDDSSISRKLEQVLTDDIFRQALEQHGLEQAKKFTWDKTAQGALGVFEAMSSNSQKNITLSNILPKKPRLAYISPLPPERSGISDYSAELLPELFRYYDIEVIVAQDDVTTPWINNNCPIRTVEWFRDHATEFDRVLYHFGNSAYHKHMFSLLESIPGVVVLHDFFLSGIISHLEFFGGEPSFWTDALYTAHGYPAIQRRFNVADVKDVIWEYPCNYSVLQNAQGVIVHSENSRKMAKRWYGKNASKDWALIPHLRVPDCDAKQNRKHIRNILGLDEQDFVVCSFGLLGPSKLNHRLLQAWLDSPLSGNPQCKLIFVGENDAGPYGQNLLANINNSQSSSRIRITGWADMDIFRQYLMAADVGVQLRTLSRGETSGTVLDCMNYGLATIVNANGSMADLPDDGVWKMPDEFSDAELIEALTTLWHGTHRCHELGERAKQIIYTQHAPNACAHQYYDAIENFYASYAASVPQLIQAIARLENSSPNNNQLIDLAQTIDYSFQPSLVQKQLLIDISLLVQFDARSGIQRVVRSILQYLLLHPPKGYRIEPVYTTRGQIGYLYARQYTLRFLNCPTDVLVDEPITFNNGDLFLGIDFNPENVPEQHDFFKRMRGNGVLVKFVLYDLLLIKLPHCFVAGGQHQFERWLLEVIQSDGVVCISQAVADEFTIWEKQHAPPRKQPFTVDWFHLGANIDCSMPTTGLPRSADSIISRLETLPSFLMVGTIEPRKGFAQTLDAFERLWALGFNINLIIVGKEGWMVKALCRRIKNHPELDHRFFWLDDISDEYLEKIYAASTCLIAASVGEGFCLPLIESAQHKVPIIARDIPVFREVASEYAYYFENNQEPEVIAKAIQNWLELYKTNQHPKSDDMPWLTWKESAEQLLKVLNMDKGS